ncbi:hypothetical protein SAMN05444407_112127 [Chryseobacterium contaminans]|uniref:Uncharacterized protein n=1 Tax=Chryseobacterium contaminans TaxID=1423959 RepID=A0A1M7HRL2_9FLAO|nr:hypothetical protein SAMN05444407_112127 [Chryseobacterium contaminans]
MKIERLIERLYSEMTDSKISMMSMSLAIKYI